MRDGDRLKRGSDRANDGTQRAPAAELDSRAEKRAAAAGERRPSATPPRFSWFFPGTAPYLYNPRKAQTR